VGLGPSRLCVPPIRRLLSARTLGRHRGVQVLDGENYSFPTFWIVESLKVWAQLTVGKPWSDYVAFAVSWAITSCTKAVPARNNNPLIAGELNTLDLIRREALTYRFRILCCLWEWCYESAYCFSKYRVKIWGRKELMLLGLKEGMIGVYSCVFLNVNTPPRWNPAEDIPASGGEKRR
jgi:hypothetical protein